jgi:hypothetical protein
MLPHISRRNLEVTTGNVNSRLTEHNIYATMIEANPATSGEVVIWVYGYGTPVRNNEQLSDFIKNARDDEEAAAYYAERCSEMHCQ